VDRGIPLDQEDDPGWKRLYVDVYRPDAEGRFPALLLATAYRREIMQFISPRPEWLASQGYAVVALDVMGTGSSEGGWECFSEREMQGITWIIDHWIPGRAWSDGKVGMYGTSYMAMASYLAAGRKPEHLKVIYAQKAAADVYRDVFFQGGLFNQEFIGVWAVGTILLSLLPGTQSLTDPESAARALADHQAQAPRIIAWMNKTEDSPFFRERSPMTYWEEVKEFPVLTLAGWFDIFTRGSLMNHTYTSGTGVTAPKRLIVGPWYHTGLTPELVEPFEMLEKRWLDWHLRSDENAAYQRYDVLDPAWPVTLYVMGREQWRREEAWPLARARNRTLYLSGARQAHDQNPSLNNGTLLREESWMAETEEALRGAGPSRISYDPHQDREQFAGQFSRSSVRWIMGVISFLGWDEDERENEKLVLTFSTDPLEEDLEVTGPITLRLWARSSFGPPCEEPPPIWKEWANLLGVDPAPLLPWARQNNVHWTVNVNDVFPSGRVLNLTSGWLSAAQRPDPLRPDWTRKGYDPFLYPESEHPSPPESDRLYEYVIEVWPTSNLFRAGHQIRIDIAVTDFPHLLPSLVPSETEILHDPEHPSRLILPVVSTESTRPQQWVRDPEAYFSGRTEWVGGGSS